MTKQNVYGITWTIEGRVKAMTIEARSLVEVLQVLKIKQISSATIILIDSKFVSTQGDNESTQLELKAA